jgi:TonB family protein
MRTIFDRRIVIAIFSASTVVCTSAIAAMAISKEQTTYQEGIENSLRKGWASRGHDRTSHNNPAVDFIIGVNGSVTKVALEKSSGDPQLDADALKLVKEMAPFSAPPDGQTDFATTFSEIDFGPYLKAMNSQIKQHWYPPKEHETNKLAVTFKVSKDGSLSHLRVGTSSNFPEVDQAGMKAVTDAAPFDPLPPGAMPVTVGFNFDYNVLAKNPAVGAAAVNPASNSSEVKTAVALNNAGVKFLSQSQFEAAIDVFLQALKVDSGYSIARSNLAIAYNNLAAKQASTPEQAISALCRSLYAAPDNATTHQNLHDTLIKSKNFGGTFADYVRLGDEAAAKHNSLNAYVMYQEALRQRADSSLDEKLKKMQKDADQELYIVQGAP